MIDGLYDVKEMPVKVQWRMVVDIVIELVICIEPGDVWSALCCDLFVRMCGVAYGCM